MFDNDKPWFAAKRWGLGGGLPIAWQGWVMMTLHLAMVFVVAAVFQRHSLAQLIVTVAVGVAPFPLYAAKTKGGWRWRSGDD